MSPRKKKQDPAPETDATGADEAAQAPEAAPAPEEAVQAPEEPLANSGEPAAEPVSVSSQMVAFHLGTQRYGFEIDRVQEIQQIVAMAQVPDENGVVLGLVNLRGDVVPAVDIRTLLGMERKEMTLETPMIVCRSSRGLVAFVVDGVDDVAELPSDCLQPPPQMHSLAGRMLGVCRLADGMVFLLDVEKLVEPVDMEAIGGEAL